ncbi:hypothetical protein D7V94_14985 [Parablautia intestinalis]|uniref:Peptidase M56 domain-containing protein n=1 Tax=Parablautia intestinalis TaxID=2320100 RepID=A0A3A9AUX7_9FIRM|nr:M56 family metallopeptidase [Parablautia intestinalis]RKI90165.1 hypothetical protein D7V94_14985 [Parablautia intestinalis]
MNHIFLSILGISVTVGLIVIVLILLTPFLNKRYTAKWKYLIWIFLAFRLLVPLSGVNGQVITDTMNQQKMQNVSESEDNYPDNLMNVTTSYRWIIVEIPEQMLLPVNTPSETGKDGISILDIAALIWITGSLIFISVHFISYFLYKRRVIKNGRMIHEAHILNHMFELKHRLHIKRSVYVMEFYEAGSPMIIGFIKPVLVLPKEQYSPEELFFIFKHELVHLKRGDVYLKLLFITANAVHWFNPLIWIMQKEADIDMELSCDERVTQGAGYALRKAYTETLLSMLQKRCAEKTSMSTQFYGGASIMKKRFQNILIKNRKKNGIFILICTVVLTISLGTLAGCSVAKGDREKENTENENTENENTENEITKEQSTVKQSMENTTILTFFKEGIQEQKQATLAIGDGYSVFLPDEEEWRLSAPDMWTTAINDQVTLWVTHFEGESADSVVRKLESDGYVKEDTHKWWKQEDDFIYHVEQKVFENDIWGVFYSYPTDCEEGWGRELSVIANTFALSFEPDNEKSNRSETADGYLDVEDSQKIRATLDAFAAAYFDGNADTIQKFLSNTYQGEIDIYEGTGVISDLTFKGLSDADGGKIEDGKCIVSLEFRDSNYEGMFLYLTFILVKEEDDWKIQFYGLEG